MSARGICVNGLQAAVGESIFILDPALMDNGAAPCCVPVAELQCKPRG